MMRRASSSSCILFSACSLLLFVQSPQCFVVGFPSYMMGTLGCMMDLSTDEVIMNAKVVPYEETDEKDVRLQVLWEEDDTVIHEPDGRTLVTLDVHTTDFPQRFPMKLSVPEGLFDIQYVAETTEGAEFFHGECDNNKRVSGRVGEKDLITLIINKQFTKPVRVWAGWAGGHEKVRLTPVIEFRMQMAAPGEDAEREKEIFKDDDALKVTGDEQARDIEDEMREPDIPEDMDSAEEEDSEPGKIYRADTIDIRSYIYGVLFYLVTFIVLFQFNQHLRRQDKGRRSL